MRSINLVWTSACTCEAWSQRRCWMKVRTACHDADNVISMKTPAMPPSSTPSASKLGLTGRELLTREAFEIELDVARDPVCCPELREIRYAAVVGALSGSDRGADFWPADGFVDGAEVFARIFGGWRPDGRLTAVLPGLCRGGLAKADEGGQNQ
jgi:hypothetical protein